MTEDQIKEAAMRHGCWALPHAVTGSSADHNAGLIAMVNDLIKPVRLIGDFPCTINTMDCAAPWEIVCEPGFTYHFTRRLVQPMRDLYVPHILANFPPVEWPSPMSVTFTGKIVNLDQTCGKCKHWKKGVMSNRCVLLSDSKVCDELFCPPSDFSCNKWEAKP